MVISLWGTGESATTEKLTEKIAKARAKGKAKAKANPLSSPSSSTTGEDSNVAGGLFLSDDVEGEDLQIESERLVQIVGPAREEPA